MKRLILLAAAATLLTVACSTKQEQPATDVADDAISLKKNLPGDSALYGLACDGCTDSVIVLLPHDGSDPVTYDILKAQDAGWLGGLLDDSKNDQKNQNVYSDGKRLKNDNTDRRLYDEQWEIIKHYPFVDKDAQKRTSAKALVMTHAYSNVVMDKIQEAVTKGIVGNEDDDW